MRSEQGHRLQQVQAALAWLDTADREHVPAESGRPGMARSRGGGISGGGSGEPGRVDAVRDHGRLDADPGELDSHRGGDAHVGVRLAQRALVAPGQLWRRELLQVVHGAHAASDRVGADAVLCMHDVVRPAEGAAEPVDGAQHAGADAFAVHPGERDDAGFYSPVDRPEEGLVVVAAEHPHGDSVPQRRQRLCQREGVHHTAAWAGGVSEQRDPQRCHREPA